MLFRSCQEHIRIIKRLTENVNAIKERWKKEAELRKAFEKLSESRDKEVSRLEVEKRELENVNQFLKSKAKAIDEDESCSSGKGPARKKRKKINDVEPLNEQMPLWIFATEKMRDFCTLRLYSLIRGPGRTATRLWDLDSIPLQESS